MAERCKVWLDILLSTMRINPDAYSPLSSRSRVSSFGYALAGWLYMLRRQRNTRILMVVSLAVLIFAWWLELDLVAWAILVLTITMVWMAEFLNAAVEAVINLATSELHPMAKVGKDVGAAAVLLGVVAAVVIGVLLFGPPLLHKLGR